MSRSGREHPHLAAADGKHPLGSEWTRAGTVQPLATAPPVRSSSRRWRFLARVMAGLAATAWPRGSKPTAVTRPAPEWNVELSSAGSAPVIALVYGQEAGVHVVRIPGSEAAAGERRRIAARLARGDVYMVSLGARGLQVHTQGPPGSNVVSMSATARFVKLSERAEGTGIRTGWW